MNEMPPQVDLDALVLALHDGAPLIDVREPGEYEEFHVPEAHLVPLMTVPDSVEQIRVIADGKPLYVICAAGGRSNRAAAFLQQQGFDAINVMGGSNEWLQRGLPTVTGGPTSL